MTDESKTQEPNLEPLELNRETLRDLTEREAEQGRGGMLPQTERGCNRCTDFDSGCEI